MVYAVVQMSTGPVRSNFTILKTDLKMLLTLFPDMLSRMNAATIFLSFIFNFGVAVMVNILHHWTLSAPNPEYNKEILCRRCYSVWFYKR